MALQALYMALVTAGDIVAIVEADEELPGAGRLPAYSKTLLCGIARHLPDLDGKLAEVSQNWSVERMPVVDHAILLLAVYEMLFEHDVPVSVCINEAVELAKGFGGEDESARFVNGLLGRIARTYCADRITGKEASAEPREFMEA